MKKYVVELIYEQPEAFTEKTYASSEADAVEIVKMICLERVRFPNNLRLKTVRELK